jgi:hypothetical protein
MEVLVKKTVDLSDQEIEEINRIHKITLNFDCSVEAFKNKFNNTALGYSFHGLLKDNGKIVGSHAGVPFNYLKNGERFMAGLGIDSMILPLYRDYFHFRDIFVECEKAMLTDGCKIRIGFPNDTSYPILKKGFKYKDIGLLDTYCLPLKASALKKSLKSLNPLVAVFSFLWLGMSYLSVGQKEKHYMFERERESFNKTRFKWFNADYKEIKRDKFVSYYKIKNKEGVETAFILDVYPLTKSNFEKTVREIYKIERKHIDMIIYVGNLYFKPFSLIKLPRKFEPKMFRFTCHVLDSEYFDHSVLNINNWDINLSSFDLL